MPGSSSAGPGLPRAMVLTSACVQAALCIAQLAVGAMYQGDCPREPYIPIYLLVMGAVSLLLVFISFLPYCDHCRICSALVGFFVCGWFITGNVWIYSIYEPNYNKTATSVDPYCNKTLYLFSFWSLNASYILFGVLVAVGCCKYTVSRM